MATYYARADGSAANKGAATDSAAAATSMSVATFNGETFSAGDEIVFSGLGGEFTSEIIPPTSGITLTGADGAVVTAALDITGTTGDWTYNETDSAWQKNSVASQVVYALWFNGMPGHRSTATANPYNVTESYQWAAKSGSVRLGGANDAAHNPAAVWSSIIVAKNMDGIDIASVDNITVDGFTFRYFSKSRTKTYADHTFVDYGSGNGAYASDQGAIRLNTTSGVTIRNCTFDRVAVAIGGCVDVSKVLVENNTFVRITAMASTLTAHDMPLASGNSFNEEGTAICLHGDSITVKNNSYDGETVYASGKTYNCGQFFFSQPTDAMGAAVGTDCMPTNLKVSGNTVRNFNNMGVFIEHLYPTVGGVVAMSVLITGNDIRYSMPTAQSRDADGIGIGGDNSGDYSASYMTGINVIANYVEGCYNAGIHYANYQGKGCICSGNTVIDCAIDTTAAQGALTVSNGVVCSKNTVVTSIQNDEGIRAARRAGFVAAAANTITNNIVKGFVYGIRGNAEGDATGSNNGVYDCTTALTNFTNTNGTTDDPQLDSDYRPQASAYKASGVWVAGVRAKDDLPISLHPDIGAYEDRTALGRRFGVGGGVL